MHAWEGSHQRTKRDCAKNRNSTRMPRDRAARRRANAEWERDLERSLAAKRRLRREMYTRQKHWSEATRWVEHVELRPGSRTAVHHARVMVDETPSSRQLDLQDPEPGFDGMDLLSGAGNPDGHFIGWTPGKTRLRPLDGMAWRLEPGTDLVVQLHMQTSGTPQEPF